MQLEDLGNTGGLEELAVQLAANAAITKRLDKLDGAFMLAIDTMLMQAERNKDPQVGCRISQSWRPWRLACVGRAGQTLSEVS